MKNLSQVKANLISIDGELIPIACIRRIREVKETWGGSRMFYFQIIIMYGDKEHCHTIHSKRLFNKDILEKRFPEKNPTDQRFYADTILKNLHEGFDRFEHQLRDILGREEPSLKPVLKFLLFHFGGRKELYEAYIKNGEELYQRRERLIAIWDKYLSESLINI